MKFQLSLVLIASLLAVAPAFADESADGPAPEGVAKHHRFDGEKCRLNLSAEQKAKMKANHFKFEEERIELVAELQRSRLALKKLLSDPKTEYKAAKAASDEVAKNRAKLASARSAFRLEMSFKILNEEQRAKALECHRFAKHRHGGKGFFAWQGDRHGSREGASLE